MPEDAQIISSKTGIAEALQARYYTTTLHRGSFYVPAYVEELLEDVE